MFRDEPAIPDGPETTRLRALVLATLVLVSLAPGATAGEAPWTADAIQRLRRVSDPQVSPDGRWVAYVVEELAPGGAHRASAIWRVSVETGEASRLTGGAGRDECPRWSPDGGRIAFLSDRAWPGAASASPGASQLWLLPAGGGEPAPLARAPGGAYAPQWSADGRFVVFVSPESEADTSAALRRAAGAGSPRAHLPWHRLWRVELASGATRRIAGGAHHVTGFSISPDGRRVAFSSQPTPEPAGLLEADLWIVPAEGGEPRPLVRRPGEDAAPAFSADGRSVAFVGQAGGPAAWWANRHVFVVPTEGGEPADLTPGFDEQARGVREGAGPLWEPGGRSLLFVATWRTDERLFRAFMDRQPALAVSKSAGVDAEPSLGGDGTVLAWTHEDPARAADLWVRRSPEREGRALTDANPEAAALRVLPKRVVKWRATDGREIEGLLIEPVAPARGAPPLLVMIHGGPAWAHVASFTPGNPVYPYALLAQSGWAVLLPNPRGSGGYGADFRGAIVGDWAGRDLDDVLSGVDELARLGLADPERLAVCGWSYGGYLAGCIVTRTGRFRAAVIGAGMADLGAALASDVPELSRWYLGRWPWEDPAAYVERSPFYRAGNVTTPTAFVHGSADRRVPPDQALAFWRALERRGVPTDFLMLPNQPHLPFDPRHQRAAMQFHLDWLTKWTLGPKPAAPARAVSPGTKGTP